MIYIVMKRISDILLSLLLICVLSIPMIFIALIVKLTSKGTGAVLV